MQQQDGPTASFVDVMHDEPLEVSHELQVMRLEVVPSERVEPFAGGPENLDH
jgi:hypothetical protein